MNEELLLTVLIISRVFQSKHVLESKEMIGESQQLINAIEPYKGGNLKPT